MSMLEEFFSVDYAGRGDLFEGLSIWEDEEYRKLQGTYPVIALSFARVKETDYVSTKNKICEIIRDEFKKNRSLMDNGLAEEDREYLKKILYGKFEEVDITSALYYLS